MTADEVRHLLEAHRESFKSDLRVLQLSVFGSVARGEASEKSDVDILVDFDGPADLLQYMELKERLEELLGIPVDLVTRKALRPALQPAIEREATQVL